MNTIQNIILKSIEKHSHLKSLGTVGGIHLNYSELYDEIKELSYTLIKCNIKKGDKVILLGENCFQWGIVYLACTMSGIVIVPLLNDFSKNEISNLINHSEAKLVFVSTKFKYKIDVEEILNVEYIFNLNNFSIDKELSRNINDICEYPTQLNFNFPQVEENDLASIIYTSGTTGDPKGVMLSNLNIVSNVIASNKVQNFEKTDRVLSILPLPHAYECHLGFILPLFRGSAVYYLNGTPSETILMPALKLVRPTIMLTVPLFIEKIYKSKIMPALSLKMKSFVFRILPLRKLIMWLIGYKLKKTFGGKLHFFGIGGAALDKEVEKFLKEVGFPYAIGYGLTETSPLVAGCNPKHTKVGSIGKFIKDLEYKLINIDAKTKIGEVVVKGNIVMLGYYKNLAKTREVLSEDRWFKTGDLGFLDKRNRLFLKGRLKNVIIGASGENIYPEDIESIINRHKMVVESIVYELKGKLIARVYLNSEAIQKRAMELKATHEMFQKEMQIKIDEILEEIRKYVNGNVGKFSKLSLVIAQSAPFDKTPTMKIKKYLYINS